MQNQDSLPLIQYVTVDSEYCPVGTWAQIFNSFQTNYVAQWTVNIPGLGLVTPAEIATINATLISLQNQITANNKAYRSGTLTFATGDNNVVINFTSAMPSTSYDIGIIFIDTAGAATAAFGWAVVDGTVATSGITIRTYDIPASVSTGTYWVRQR